jgi:hypothetical protein
MRVQAPLNDPSGPVQQHRHHTALLSEESQNENGDERNVCMQDSAFMLAAGGYAGSVQLWDARASKHPSTTLQVPSSDTVTALHCCHRSQCAVAGTESGRVHVWDLRMLQSRQPLLTARGATCGSPVATVSPPAALAANPTLLPRSALLQLCLARLRHSSALDTAHAASLADESQAVVGAGTVRLCTAPAFSAAGQASYVTQLLPHPCSHEHVAFSMACGAAGAYHDCPIRALPGKGFE